MSNLWCFVAIYAVLLQNVDLRSFVAISVLSRSTRFYVEKIQPRITPRGEKITNMRYGIELPGQQNTFQMDVAVCDETQNLNETES